MPLKRVADVPSVLHPYHPVYPIKKICRIGSLGDVSTPAGPQVCVAAIAALTMLARAAHLDGWTFRFPGLLFHLYIQLVMELSRGRTQHGEHANVPMPEPCAGVLRPYL